MKLIQAVLNEIHGELTQVSIHGLTDQRREVLLALAEALKQAIKAA